MRESDIPKAVADADDTDDATHTRRDGGAAPADAELGARGGEAALPGCPSRPGLGVCNVSR